MAYTFGVSGVLEVSRVMAIPFGHDDVDLPARKFWERVFKRSFEVLQERCATISRSPRLDVDGMSTEHSALLEQVVLDKPPTVAPPLSDRSAITLRGHRLVNNTADRESARYH